VQWGADKDEQGLLMRAPIDSVRELAAIDSRHQCALARNPTKVVMACTIPDWTMIKRVPPLFSGHRRRPPAAVALDQQE
jgi:hypothetical protein